MELSSHTVLITGGATGIGFAFARRFHQAGSEVIICGRRGEKLAEARKQLPGIRTFQCDVSREEERSSLVDQVVLAHPRFDVLINNAGIQRRLNLREREEWKSTGMEIACNLEAPVHFSTLVIPHFSRQVHPAIINVTSGLSFVPLARVPIYCATKAALHSFTLSLRHQLTGTGIEVIEVIPPSVNTDLGGPGLHSSGTDVDEFADVVMTGLQSGTQEIAYGFSEQTSHASRPELDEVFRRMNQTPH
jgi:uncharacterized oxidoreductase